MSETATFILLAVLGAGIMFAVYLVVRLAFRHEAEQMAREAEQARKRSRG